VGVILQPNNTIDDVMINWWNWRPTVNLLLQAGAISSGEAECLSIALGTIEVSGQQAIRMADAVDAALLLLVNPGDRLLLNGQVTVAPPVHPVFRPGSDAHDMWDWYGAQRSWLETFSTFCRLSGGFTPL